MILDTLNNSSRYIALHPGFAKAFRFLERRDLADLPAGRHAIDGDRVYALVGKDEGRGQAAAKLEAHRKYIDIQYVVSGDERIGWADARSCTAETGGYSPEKDIEFFTTRPARWLPVPPKTFAVFFPDDAHAPHQSSVHGAGHAPLAGRDRVHKVVVKVAVV